ncbi:MAG: hypothetical protein IPN77_33580, partial [Sandaracinaceae bacterium]|nr:hypothetical protein [Sandaracinaceae bacterium]
MVTPTASIRSPASAATLIPADSTGLIQPNLTRGHDGVLWAAVWAAPEETNPAPVRIARVRSDGVDIYDVEAPTYMESPESVTNVYPGESFRRDGEPVHLPVRAARKLTFHHQVT